MILRTFLSTLSWTTLTSAADDPPKHPILPLDPGLQQVLPRNTHTLPDPKNHRRLRQTLLASMGQVLAILIRCETFLAKHLQLSASAARPLLGPPVLDTVLATPTTTRGVLHLTIDALPEAPLPA